MLESFEAIVDALPYLLGGVPVTVAAVLGGMALGLIIGVPLAVAQVYGHPLLGRLAGVYVWYFRGTPILVLLFMFYFGLFPLMELNVNALTATAIVLGLAGAASALISMFLNLGIDQAQDLKDGDAVGYPGFAGFELEDGIYLIAPITWGGYLLEFFTAAGIGAAVYTLWSLATLLRLRKNNQ